MDGLRHSGLQRLRQHLAIRQQLLQRITHQRELLAQRADAVLLAAGHGRPGVLGHGHALLGQRQQCRVETAQPRCLVVRGGLRVCQPPGLAHGRQARCLVLGGGHCGVVAEEEQVLRQAIRKFALAAHAHAQLGQQARRQALGVYVAGQQPAGLRFQHGRGQLPEGGDLRVAGQLARPGTQVGAQVTHAGQRDLGGRSTAVTHQRQHQGLHRPARVLVGRAWRSRWVCRQLAPLPLHLPQVGRMHAVGTGQLLRRPVLREQCHRRDGLAGELPRQEVQQAERHMLHGLDRGDGHQRRLGHHLLHGHFRRAQHMGRFRQADEFEGADALVDLIARVAQHRRVHHVDIRSAQRFGFLQVAAQRLVGVFQCTAQFAVDPGQGAQVIARRIVAALALGFHLVLHR